MRSVRPAARARARSTSSRPVVGQVAAVAVGEDLEQPAHHVQRLQQVVADDRGEAVELGVGALQLGRVAAEGGLGPVALLQPLGQEPVLLLDGAGLLVEGHEHRHLRPQHLGLERLGQVVDRPRLVAPQLVLGLPADGGEEDDGDVGAAGPALDQPGRLVAVHPRHLDVEQDHREVVDEHLAEGVGAGGGPGDVDVEGLEGGLQGEEVVGPVVDDEDAGAHGRSIGGSRHRVTRRRYAGIASGGTARR